MEIKKLIYKFRYYLYAYFLLIIQLSFVNNGLFFSLYPNLLLIYVSFVSQKFTNKTAYLIALISGILYDVLLSATFGIRALIFFIIALVISKSSEYIFSQNFRTSVFYTLTAVIIYNILLYIIYYFLSYKVYFKEIIYNILSIETLVSIMIFFLMENYIFTNKKKILPVIKKFFLNLRKGNLNEKNSN